MKFDVGISVSENGRRRPEYSLNTDLNGEISLIDFLQWTKQALLVTADEVLKDAQKNGFDKNPLLIVDGRPNKPPGAVNPLGEIEFVSRINFDDMLLDAYQSLLKRSPVDKGVYISSHYVFKNGIQVATSLQELQTWLATNPEFKEKDTIRIVNIQPYARRLELLGVTAQRTQSKREDSGRRNKQKTGKMVRIPNGTYQLTARSLKTKYKRNVSIRFTFLPGSSLGLSGSFKGNANPKKNKYRQTKKNSLGRPYLYPTIVFSISERGIL